MLGMCNLASRHSRGLSRHIFQSLKIVEEFCYLIDTRARGGAIDIAVARIRNEWCRFRDSVPI